MSEHTREQFSEEVSLLRKYSFEFSSQKDDETYDLMIASQVNLHKLYEDAKAEITSLKYANKELVEALEELKQAAKESNDAEYETLSTTFVLLTITPALEKAKGME